MTTTLPMPSLEFGALQQALKRALLGRGMTWEKFEVGAQLARLEVSAQLEGFLDAFLASLDVVAPHTPPSILKRRQERTLGRSAA